nr:MULTISPECIES: hypothetical protein [Rikenellaceae]
MDDPFDRLPHLLVVADKLAFRHRYLPGVRPYGIGLARAPVCPGMGADTLRELSTLVVECGVRQRGGIVDSFPANGRPDRTAHFSRDMQERPFRLLVPPGLPSGAEKAFALEIPVEHFGKLDFHVGEYISDQFVRFGHLPLLYKQKTIIFAKTLVMLDYNNLKLQERTFLDFTDDPAIISKVLGVYDRAWFLGDVEHTPALRWNTYLEFADLLSDETLAAKIREAAIPELRSLRDE